jgi:NAD-dependent deacetylase
VKPWADVVLTVFESLLECLTADMSHPEAVAKVREAIGAARNIMAITGAGISAESGVPTFRDSRGLWVEFDPEEYATPRAFARDPARAWTWYDMRRQNMAGARPNPAHTTLAELEQTGRRVFVVTQNVDDLHEQAGSREVTHIHGSMWHVRCPRDGAVEENRDVPLTEIPPRCSCGGLFRPAVVWFGETLPWQPLEDVRRYLLAGDIDVCLVVGTEASFGYIIEWSFHARESGALLVDVNPRATGLSGVVDVHLEASAGEIMPQLLPELS